MYSTYLGGTESDYGNAIAVDSSGNAYIAGTTNSNNFPTKNAYQDTFGGGLYDGFITKLNATGDTLLYSTYLGGYGYDIVSGIAVDTSGNAYITGNTDSNNFPTKNAYQDTFGGGLYDGFITKLNATGDTLLYSTYLGGTESDAGNAIAVDSSGNAYITGSTGSNNFPTKNAYQDTFGGFDDAFITKLNATGDTLLYSTYLGGYDFDNASGIAIDTSGNAYITGSTGSNNFPTKNAYQDTSGGYYGDAFVAKFYDMTCSFEISPNNKDFSWTGEKQVINVDALNEECSWTVSDYPSWVEVSTEGETGDGQVTVTVHENNDPDRTGTVSIGDKEFNIKQEKTKIKWRIENLGNCGFPVIGSDGTIFVLVSRPKSSDHISGNSFS